VRCPTCDAADGTAAGGKPAAAAGKPIARTVMAVAHAANLRRQLPPVSNLIIDHPD
jgi:hypothetical protein